MTVKTTTQLVHLRHDQLIPAGDNVRSSVGDVSELALSILSVGILQPLRVSMPEGAKKATIVAGARRHAAVGLLIEQGSWKKTQTIPCVFDGELDDETRIVAMLVENLQRADLDPIEEALGYQRLISEFKFTRERVRLATGRSKTAVQVRLALLKLAPEVQAAVASRELSLDIASRLAALPEDVQAVLLASNGVAGITTHRIDEAERRIAREQLRDRFVRDCTARGLMPTDQQSWQLTKTHNLVQSGLPAKDLAFALLPADIVDGYARLDQYNSTVDIWSARLDLDTSGSDELDAWQAECARIRTEHQRAVVEWNDRLKALAAGYARKASPRVVHDASLRWLLFEQDVMNLAEQVGFQLPDRVVTDEESEELLEQWLKQPSNLVAVAALEMLTHDWVDTELRTQFLDHVSVEIGDKPELAEMPPRPIGSPQSKPVTEG
jgi:ParB/RepB/Spo0J family partition protein